MARFRCTLLPILLGVTKVFSVNDPLRHKSVHLLARDSDTRLSVEIRLKKNALNKYPTRDNLSKFMRIYSEQGAIKADNALKLHSSLNNTNSTISGSFALSDLQFIVRTELGEADNIVHPQPQTLIQPNCLADTLHCWAQALRLRVHDLHQASYYAQLLLDYHLKDPDANIPTNWIAESKTIIAEAACFQSKNASCEENPTLAQEWDLTLKQDPSAPSAVTDLLKMIGLQTVKAEIIRLYHRSILAKEQGDDAFSYNALFHGNPGSGKSTVAAHYLTFLKQLGVLPRSSILVEASGASLIADEGCDRLAELKARLRLIKKARGGVFYLQDAHQLLAEAEGRAVWRGVLQRATGGGDRKGRVVWVLAGQPREMEPLWGAQPAAQSRFPVRLGFADFSDDELLAILESKLVLGSSKQAQAAQQTVAAAPNENPAAVPQDAAAAAVAQQPQTAGALGAASSKPKARTARDRYGGVWTSEEKGNLWTDEYGGQRTSLWGSAPDYCLSEMSTPDGTTNSIG